MKPSNNMKLRQAKRAKEDEFYTQRQDIDAEIRFYKKHFKNKVVYCNCDDPKVSEFFKYFYKQFDELGIKKLITTCYKSQDSNAYTKNRFKKSIYIEYTGIKKGFKLGNLEGDGDFRSDECVAMLKKADIVITNPPFSLFREYISQLIEHKKEFLIIGNMNALTYREIFALIKGNKLWLGNNSGSMQFKVPDYYPPRKSRFWIDENGQKWRSMGNTCWFTNMDIDKRHELLNPYKEYDKREHPHYDNYNAINVDKVKDIPKDWDGYMGVPITFLEKHNPDEFDVLGIMNTGEENEGIRLPNTEHGRPLVNGVEKYLRVIIKNRNPMKRRK